MDLKDLNNLLKAYGITIECDSCENLTHSQQDSKPKSFTAKHQTKKIKKKSAKICSKNSEKERKISMLSYDNRAFCKILFSYIINFSYSITDCNQFLDCY